MEMRYLKTYENFEDNPKHIFNIIKSEIEDILVDISDDGIDVDVDIKSYGYPREILCTIRLTTSSGFLPADYISSLNHLSSFMSSRGFKNSYPDQHKPDVRLKILLVHYHSTGKIQGELSSNQNEGFFDNLFGKKPFNNPDIEQVVNDTFIDLSDNGFEVKIDKSYDRESDKPIEFSDFGEIASDKEIVVSIKKAPQFSLSEIADVLKFATPFLKKEIGLKLFDICFRETKWTHKTSWTGIKSGTKAFVRYTSLSQIKGDETTSEVKVTFK